MRFAMVPEAAFHADVSYRAFKVYAAICLHADRRSGECHPTNERLGEVTAIHPRKVIDCIHELESAALIRCARGPNDRIITVTKTVTLDSDQNGHPSLTEMVTPGGDQNGHRGVTKTVTGGVTETVTPINRTDQGTDHLTDQHPPDAGAGAREGSGDKPPGRKSPEALALRAWAEPLGRDRDGESFASWAANQCDFSPPWWIRGVLDREVVGFDKPKPTRYLTKIMARFREQGYPDFPKPDPGAKPPRVHRIGRHVQSEAEQTAEQAKWDRLQAEYDAKHSHQKGA